MPLDPVTGQCVSFSPAQVTAMNIRTFDVQRGAHPTETRKRDESTMLRTFLVAWGSRFDFCELCLGNSVLWVNAGTTKLSRLLPDSNYGRHPSFQQIMGTRVEYIRGHGCGIDDISGMPSYTDAEVQIYYEFAPYVAQSDAATTSERERFVTISDTIKSEAEAFTLPGGAMKYAESGGGGITGTPVPINISIIRPVERFTLWWDQLPYDLVESTGALYKRLYFGKNAGLGIPDGIPFIGCVNADALDIPSAGQTYNPGTLLLEGVERIKYRSPLAESGLAGLRAKVGFNVAFTPRGWLNLPFVDPLTPGNTKYAQAVVDGTYHTVDASFPDNTGLYNVRTLADLWDPNY